MISYYDWLSAGLGRTGESFQFSLEPANLNLDKQNERLNMTPKVAVQTPHCMQAHIMLIMTPMVDR